jgi:hypothetical protein
MNIWRIRYELACVHATLFFLRGTGWSDPSYELCQFLVDRYLRLHKHYQSRGRGQRAKRFFAKAEKFWFLVNPKEPPPSAALAMPVPLPPLSTWAVSGRKDREDIRKVA